MRSIRALSLAPGTRTWLQSSRQLRVLHIFDSACNLINERRDVLSVVTPDIGEGPFHLVVQSGVRFFDELDIESSISIADNFLLLGDLRINMTKASLWDPHPDWKSLHARRKHVFHQLNQLQGVEELKIASLASPLTRPGILHGAGMPTSRSPVSVLPLALAMADIASAQRAASQLAGSGIGLTPTGDDFLMGAIYAAWIVHPTGTARALTGEIAAAAAPLTTSLSAAWLRSAGKGEAGVLWHELFDALISEDISAIQGKISRLRSVGHTSGADALAGFFGTMVAWAELVNSKAS